MQLYRTVILIIAISIILNSCQRLSSQQKDHLYRKSAVLMDTIVTITVVSESSKKADSAINLAFTEIKNLEEKLNFYSEKSEISEINRNAGIKPVNVSEDTIDILKKAIYVSEITDGAFDITIGPLVKIWDFHNRIIPDSDRVKEELRYVNYKDIVINEKEKTVFLKKKGMLINPGAIAKGYAADRAIEGLKRNGITSCLVAVAGDIRVMGLKPDGTPWTIGIRHPRSEKMDAIIATIPLRDAAISTSGDYERFFIKDGRRYHHILDPKIGFPSQSTGGVSVITDAGYLSDSLATAVFVLGHEKGIELLKRLSYRGIFITEDLRMHTTGHIEGLKSEK